MGYRIGSWPSYFYPCDRLESTTKCPNKEHSVGSERIESIVRRQVIIVTNGTNSISEHLKDLSNALAFHSAYQMKPKYIQVLNRPKEAFMILLARAKYKISGSSTVTSTNLFFNEEMIIKLPESVSENLYLYHFFEFGLSNALLSLLKPGMIFVDIGAHFGYFTLLASYLLAGKGMVHSFEPIGTTFEFLLRNIDGRPYIKANNCAVWSSNTNLEFHDYGERFAALNSFTEPRLQDFKGSFKKIQIAAITLDTYFGDENPDFVKIDAESAELEILKGMDQLINRSHPMISLEVGDFNNNKSRPGIEYLISKGYSPFECKTGKLEPHTLRDEYVYDNLIFLRS